MRYIIDHIPQSTPHNRRPGLSMTPTTITIHNTGNSKSRARDERAWLANPANVRTASFHIVVDDTEAIECIPLNEVAWHAGDGSGVSSGNRTSIGIEICESGNYERTMQNAVVLVAHLLRERGWGVDRLRRHYDWSRKICPRLMHDGGKWTGWEEFKRRVAAELEANEPMTKEEKQAFDALVARVAALETKIPAPAWFVEEFGSADLGGLIQEPRFTLEGWRTLAVALRAVGNGLGAKK
ncbi:MAG: N-acetylmuramoyl-L-alanine amidase [Candidatus Reconcilbacillus cellulovorans]|uniref:N-acetylmuramoyl-L-alanine amidase n=1 Tax=Candidatus Reconcilbacillus cellulovorans TaxID=1906605 RepID=A0A2A6E3L1_9BACL|nr:MAG: N-acetylmuramoyl-L-alanine amidase [Candidatus Reconcilbacillus cellulovorans]